MRLGSFDHRNIMINEFSNVIKVINDNNQCLFQQIFDGTEMMEANFNTIIDKNIKSERGIEILKNENRGLEEMFQKEAN
jgi:hypothetical protein